jgi:hypothetical protein
MRPVKLDPKIILGSHAFLLDRLAFAIDWVRHARKKITLYVPDHIEDSLHTRSRSQAGCIPPPTRPRSQAGCIPPPTRPRSQAGCIPIQWPDARADVELLLAVLDVMEETLQEHPEVGARIKPRK